MASQCWRAYIFSGFMRPIATDVACSVVCVSVCLFVLVTRVSCAKLWAVENWLNRSKCLFGGWLMWVQRNMLDGVQIPNGRGTFRGSCAGSSWCTYVGECACPADVVDGCIRCHEGWQGGSGASFQIALGSCLHQVELPLWVFYSARVLYRRYSSLIRYHWK